MNTYNTKFGKVTLYKNDVYIENSFRHNQYWDEINLYVLRQFINPNLNILEIGGHCGTSSIVYSSYLNEGQKVHVYEPQLNMYNLLVKNISQNNLQNKIIPYNSGVFCFSGKGKMNNIDLDGGGGIVEKRYNEENNLGCNFGGISLGIDGESINLTTIDEMNLNNIGFIHCDTQGAENFIFSKALKTIRRDRPVIFYEDNQKNAKYLYNNVCNSYPDYEIESIFNIDVYCMEKLNYSKVIRNFNGGIDTLLIP